MSDELSLSDAINLYLGWVESAPQPPWSEFLAAHEPYRELLEPMHEEVDDPRSDLTATTASVDLVDPGSHSASAEGRKIGDFRILDELGRGGMGVVYRARQVSLNRIVALKVLPPHLTLTNTAIHRFQQEAELTANLDHPGIVRVHTVGQEDGTWFFAMDLIEGAPLSQLIKGLDLDALSQLDGTTLRARVGLPLSDATSSDNESAWSRTYIETIVRLSLQVAEALEHAHQAQILHRDIKPSNILVRGSGQAVLADFGLARQEGLPSMTLTGEFAGTPFYVSPEQISAKKMPVDARSDVFSLGATLYELFTLRRPFLGETTQEVFALIQSKDPPDPQRINPGLPVDLAAITLKALEKEPARRYQSAAELAADLRSFLNYRPIRARQITRFQRGMRWARRNRLVASLIGVVATLSICGTIALAWQNQQLDRSLSNVLRLSDAELLDKYLGEHNHLPASHPDDLPQLRAWQAKVAPVLERMPAHRARLIELREQALPYTDTDREQDYRTSPVQERLQRKRDWLDVAKRNLGWLDEGKTLNRGITREDAMQWKEISEAAIPGLEAQARERRTFRFTQREKQWEHDLLTRLVEKLDRFTHPERGTHVKVAEWADHMASVRAATLEGTAKAAWEATIAAIASDVRYRGLQLQPQLGLRPLGKDPKSGLFEFAHLQSGTPPARNDAGQLQPTDDTGLVFVLLPGGKFTMGAREPKSGEQDGGPNLDAVARPNEAPVHEVELAPFFLSKFEMTQGQWHRLLGRTPSRGTVGDMLFRWKITWRNPVNQVSWVTCTEVAKMFSLQLPTEAQWEYAARAGSTARFPGGHDVHQLRGTENIFDQAGAELFPNTDLVPRRAPWDDEWGTTAPVGTFRANPFGLHDMLGNVAEWCRDEFGPYGDPASPRDGLRVEVAKIRPVIRGGSMMTTPPLSRVTSRDHADRWLSAGEIGFRPTFPITVK